MAIDGWLTLVANGLAINRTKDTDHTNRNIATKILN